MGAMSKPKKKKTRNSVTKQAPEKRTQPASQAGAAKSVHTSPPAPEAPAVSLFMPTQADAARNRPRTTRPLSGYVLQKLVEKDPQLAARLITLQDSTVIFEADLATLLQRREVRQLVLTQTKEGWEAQVLPIWKGEFLTLVSLKKEKRRYKDLDRLISTITMHGPLPPTILIGE